MKKIIIGLALIAFSYQSQAQFICDFEECTESGTTNECSGNWTDWGCGGGPGCSIVCAEGGHTGEWSGMIPGDGTTDAVLDLGNKIFDTWGLEFWMYIPSGKEAYFNLQGEVPIGSGEWIVGNIFFNQGLANPGVGLIDDSVLGNVSFSFPHDEWFRVVMNFDISAGLSVATWQFNVAGIDVLPIGTPFTNEAGTIPTSLGGINFYSISQDNLLFVDDFNYINGEILDTQELNIAVSLTLYPNPAQDWIMIETKAAIQTISIYDLQGKIVMKKEVINNVGISELTRGLYFIEVQTDHGKAVRRLIKN